MRGIGWCSQQSFTFVTLLNRLGIPAHLIYLYKKGLDESNHSVAEAYVNGKWVLFDSLFGFVPMDKQTKRLLSPNEVIDYVTKNQSDKIGNAIAHPTPIYLGYYTGRAEVVPRNSSKPDKYLRYSRFLIRTFALHKPWATSLIQDAYFQIHLNASDPKTRFQRARLLYFTGRYDLASKYFDHLVSFDHVKYQDSLLWGGVNAIENKQPEKALSYFETLTKYREEQKPERQILDPVLAFFKSKAYLQMGKKEEAKKFVLESDYETASESLRLTL